MKILVQSLITDEILGEYVFQKGRWVVTSESESDLTEFLNLVRTIHYADYTLATSGVDSMLLFILKCGEHIPYDIPGAEAFVTDWDDFNLDEEFEKLP